jgi:hypothetical protein
MVCVFPEFVVPGLSAGKLGMHIVHEDRPSVYGSGKSGGSYEESPRYLRTGIACGISSLYDLP